MAATLCAIACRPASCLVPRPRTALQRSGSSLERTRAVRSQRTRCPAFVGNPSGRRDIDTAPVETPGGGGGRPRPPSSSGGGGGGGAGDGQDPQPPRLDAYKLIAAMFSGVYAALRFMSIVAVLAAGVVLVAEACDLTGVKSLESAVDELRADVQDLKSEQHTHRMLLAGIASFLVTKYLGIQLK